MEKTFTTSRVVRGRLALVAAMLTASLGASAGSQKFYNFYDEFHAYPTGAGKIYVSTSNSVDTSTLAEADWSADAEQQFCKYGLSGCDFYIYTKPADGWIAVGVSTGVREDENSDWHPTTDSLGNVVIGNVESPLRYTPVASTGDADSLTAVSQAPMFPEACAYAVFTHVAPRVAEGQTPMGSVATDKTVNLVGDNIKLTATPKDARCHFAYWTRKSDGATYTDNPLQVNVSGADEYVVNFTCDSAMVLNYPEGKYIIWKHDSAYTFTHDGTATAYSFVKDSLKTTDSGMYYIGKKPNTSVLSVGAPLAFYIKGTAYAFCTPGYNSWYSISNSLASWSGEDGVAAADINSESHYYVADVDNECFSLLADTGNGIPARTVYLTLTADNITTPTVPQKIYWSEEAAMSPTGIKNVGTGVRVADGKIYTIGGVEVRSMGHGIYVINGKKVINNK